MDHEMNEGQKRTTEKRMRATGMKNEREKRKILRESTFGGAGGW